MFGPRRPSFRCGLRPSMIALLIGLGPVLAGCASTPSDLSASATSSTGATLSDSEWRQRIGALGERYRANPGEARTAIDYAQALRATGQHAQAASVLQQATIRNPKDPSVLGAYGRALADNGQFEEALDFLSRAHTPDARDWRILNAQGAVLDQMGRNAEARNLYQQALAIAPDEPAVLSNLGLSYAFSKQLADAENVLRRANANPRADRRVRQNLALVVGLQGRFEEAEQIARADLPSAEAQANVAYLRDMLANPRAQHAVAPGAAKPRPQPQAANTPRKVGAPMRLAETQP